MVKVVLRKETKRARNASRSAHILNLGILTPSKFRASMLIAHPEEMREHTRLPHRSDRNERIYITQVASSHNLCASVRSPQGLIERCSSGIARSSDLGDTSVHGFGSQELDRKKAEPLCSHPRVRRFCSSWIDWSKGTLHVTPSEQASGRAGLRIARSMSWRRLQVLQQFKYKYVKGRTPLSAPDMR